MIKKDVAPVSEIWPVIMADSDMDLSSENYFGCEIELLSKGHSIGPCLLLRHRSWQIGSDSWHGGSMAIGRFDWGFVPLFHFWCFLCVFLFLIAAKRCWEEGVGKRCVPGRVWLVVLFCLC